MADQDVRRTGNHGDERRAARGTAPALDVPALDRVIFALVVSLPSVVLDSLCRTPHSSGDGGTALMAGRRTAGRTRAGAVRP